MSKPTKATATIAYRAGYAAYVAGRPHHPQEPTLYASREWSQGWHAAAWADLPEDVPMVADVERERIGAHR